jgi:hypothetical protein
LSRLLLCLVKEGSEGQVSQVFNIYGVIQLVMHVATLFKSYSLRLIITFLWNSTMHDVTRAYDVRLHDVNHTIGLLTSVFFVIFSISEVYRWRHHQPGPSSAGAAISRDRGQERGQDEVADEQVAETVRIHLCCYCCSCYVVFSLCFSCA